MDNSAVTMAAKIRAPPAAFPEIRLKIFGPQHPDVASILYNLANLYVELSKQAQAEPLYQRSLEMVEKAFGPAHPKVVRRLRSLAELYRAQGRSDEAARLDSRLQGMEKTV